MLPRRPLLTESDVQQLFGITPSGLEHLVSRGLPLFMLGEQRRFPYFAMCGRIGSLGRSVRPLISLPPSVIARS